jgi:acyl-CoA synthetase (AMP-forming)/AMP-acid ligase II
VAPNYVRDALDLFAGFGADEALVSGDARLTYADLRQRVPAMAAALLAHGVRPGSTVATLVGNAPDAIVAQFGLHLLGCRSVWLAPNAPRRYRIDFLRLAEAGAFIYDARQLPKMGRLMAQSDPGLLVLCLGPGGDGPDLTPALDAAGQSVPPGEVTTEPESLFQTGGTTGTPKLVHQRHRYFQTVHAQSLAWMEAGQHRLRHLSSTGFWHISGQQGALMTLFSGGTLFLDYDFDIGKILGIIERERITSTFFTPPIYYQFLDHPDLDRTDTSSLQMVSVGGSACAPSRLVEGIERLGPVLRPVYGMTEAPLLTALPALGSQADFRERLASCGQPYGDIALEIRDEKGEALPSGEVGAVWVSGGLTMSGYWGQPELTGETLVDGWLGTGDVGYLDADGYLYLVDRQKDIIITGLGSTNVYTRPVEDVLAAHPAVSAAAIIGVPDEEEGEAVHAVVVPVPGATVTPEELRDLVRSELNDIWAPKRVEFVSELPLTDVGKVDKNALRARYTAQAG